LPSGSIGSPEPFYLRQKYSTDKTVFLRKDEMPFLAKLIDEFVMA